MLRDIRTEALREVDITAENVVAGYPVIISIEVRDRGRAADVAWVEEMAQKHADLPTSKLALWSATGFSAQATRKAGALSVALVTPDDLETAPLASLARNVMGGSVKMVQIRFEAVADVRLDDGSMERWPVSFATLIEPVGGDTGLGLPVGWFVSVLEKDPELRSDVLTQAPLGRGDFFAVYEPPIPAIVRHEDGRIGALSRLLISMYTTAGAAPLSVRSIVHKNTATTLAEAPVLGGTLSLTIRESATAMPQVDAVHQVAPQSSGPHPSPVKKSRRASS